MKKLDQIRRSQSEDICVLLREVEGVPYVELRVYRRSEDPDEDPRPGPEGISIPVNALQELLRVLTQTHERLARDGIAHPPPPSQTTKGSDGLRRDSRRQLRVPIKLSVGCLPMSTRDPRSSAALFGEIKDLSIGGAQVWLPERFSLFCRLEISARIGGLEFQGRAEVVGAEVHPTQEGYRHSMRWLGLSNHAKATLSQVIARS